MAGYTLEQFREQYATSGEGRLGGHPPGREPVKIHYCRWAMFPVLELRWRSLLLRELTIDATDRVLVVGCAFGWSCEVIENETGATVVGVDISDYIHATKDLSDRDEIRQDVIEAGLDPDSGRGLEVLDAISTPGPRTSATILNVDVTRRNQHKQITDALGGPPTVIVFEEIIDETMPALEIEDLNNAAKQLSATIVWLTLPLTHIAQAELEAATQGARVIDHTRVLPPERI